jgi:hypothetical protein
MKKSFVSPKLSISKTKIGKGLIAIQRILKDEVVVDFSGALGEIVNNGKAAELFRSGHDYSIQIDDDQFFASVGEEDLEEADFINHSCNPNCGISGSLKIVAMRNIMPGEEITFDYAMSESSNYEMGCLCGADNCRGIITGEDWKIPKLQRKYKGYFSDYLQKKIDQ